MQARRLVVELILLLLLQVAAIHIRPIQGLRVESLRELKHDATSITFEWNVYDSSVVASSTGIMHGIYSGEESTDPIGPPPANTGGGGASYEDPFKSTGSPASSSSAELVTYEWIGFKIKYFTDKLQYKPILLKNLNVRKFRLDTLKPNTEYKIQVSAYSSAELEGPASNLLIVRTLDAVPGEPQEFKVVRVTSTSIELEWKPPRRDDHSHSHNIKGYEIHYFKVNGPAQSSSSSLSGGTQSHASSASASAESKDDTQVFKRKANDIKKLKYTLTDLEPNSVYKIQIFAYNMRGDGQRSPPLVVTTLDDGPNKPENIRSEIYNDVLQIRWQPPLKAGKDQPVSGYRLFFNNEKYDVDGRANHISLERPKWEYDRYYEFRIAAKSALAPSVFGQEAFYRISTFTNQTKINIKIEKLTSSSVHLRWNSVQYQAASGLQPYYKLEYWLQSNPNNVNTHDRLNLTDMHIRSLKPNSDYIIQIVALIPPNNIYISEPTLKHFRTPLFDLPAPINLQLMRYEAESDQFDKCDIKWEMPDPSRLTSVLKGYRVYYRELSENVAHGYEEEEESSAEDDTFTEDDDYLYSDANLDWKMAEFDSSSLTTNDYTLVGLRRDRDYAIKLAAVDYAGNEGEDSQVYTALKLLTSPVPEHVDESTQTSVDQQQSPSDQVPGAPRNLEVTEVTSTSVKFAWMPPKLDTSSRNAKDFRLSYVDRPKQYRECNGSIVTYARGLTMSVKVPGRGDPDMKITWLVTGLAPYTDYSFNISTLLANEEPGPTVQRRIRTRPDRPIKVEQPVVLEAYSDNTVLLKLGNASEQNGPISKYWLVIVPVGANSFRNRIQKTSGYELMGSEARERDIAALVRYSQYNNSVSNESAFIAAEFDASNWPEKFILGDGRNYFGGFLNRRLTPNFDYRAYIVAFTKDALAQAQVHSQSTTIQSHKQQVKSPNNIGTPNMLGLGDLFGSSTGLDSELFSYSPNSLVFDTKYGSDGSLPSAIPHGSGTGASAQALNGYFHVFWVAGAIAAFIFIFILVVGISVNVMHTNKKKQNKLISSSPNNTTHLVMTTAGNRISGGASSMGTSSTTTQPNKSNYLDTAVTLTKSGVVATNTMKKNSTANNTMSQQQQLIAAMMSSASSSTTSSTAAGSPTNTALLSCSVNNTNTGGGSHPSTNSNTMLINPNGLLTAASPLKHQNTSAITPTLVSESLYTSIEATQRLILQGKQHHYNPYEVNMTSSPTATNSSLNATLNNTLMRMNQLSATYQYNQHLSSQFLHYDPIEWRRLNFSSPGLLSNPPVPCEELAQHVERLRANNNSRLSAEYESIEPEQQFTWQCSTMELNRAKNRYANVVAYDHSRVVLAKLPPHAFSSHSNNTNATDLPPPPPPPPGSTNPNQPTSPNSMSACSDYINANYMDGYRCRNAYIATQGPLPSTLGDFWRMIWEQQTHTIVMLTRLEERQRLKCDQYWPNKGTETYDNVMQVTMMDCQELSTYTVRTFVIQPVNIYAHLQQQANTNSIQRREVKHFQYTAWPDHGVPEHPTSFLMFIRRVKLYNSQQIETNCTSNGNSSGNNSTTPSVVVGPIVVHCSAGVGRTGCFICVDTMMDRLRLGAERSVDIYGHVTCLRAQRNYMVQTEDQYGFIYDSCLEVVQTMAPGSNPTDVPIRDLYQHLQQLLQISADDPQQMLTEMELEYKRLSNAKAPQSKFHAANMPANKFKNRLVNILPYESTRVCLDGDPLTGTDYINANFVDGYRYKKAYIATQAPLAETCDDFWRMLWEHDTSLIVMLTKLREMGREKCAQYWPAERRSVRYQYFVVDPVAEYNMGAYVLREFKVTDARDGQSRTVRQFQFVDWPEQGVPKSAESILELIGQVHKTKEQFGQTGPICVHCSAGVGRTGVFITLSIVLERMRYEGMCDVFNTVKMLRQQRPAMVQTEDQYQFCYRAALEYLGSFENNYD